MSPEPLTQLEKSLASWAVSDRRDAGSRAEEVLSSIIRAGHSLSAEVCVNYIQAMSASQSNEAMAPDRALRALDRVLAFGGPAEAAVYNEALIAWLGDASRRPDAVLKSRQLFDRMVFGGTEPDKHTWMAAMRLWVRLGYHEGMDLLLAYNDNKANALHLGLAASDYRCVLEELRHRPSLANGDRARRLCEQMQLRTGQTMVADDYHLLVALYGALTPATEDTVSLVQRVIREMTDQGLFPSTRSYLTLCEAYCSVARSLLGDVTDEQDPREEDALLTVMRADELLVGLEVKGGAGERGVMASTEEALSGAYAAVIDMYCKLDRVERARQILKQAIDSKVSLDTFTFNSLFAALGTACEGASAGAVCPPDRGRVCLTDVDELFTLMHNFAPQIMPDQWTFSTLVTLFLRLGAVGRAYGVFEEATEKGMYLNIDAYRRLAHGLCKDGAYRTTQVESVFVAMCTSLQRSQQAVDLKGLEACEQTLDHIRRSGLWPTLASYNAMFRAYLLRPTGTSAERASVQLNRFLSSEGSRCGIGTEEELEMVDVVPTMETYMLLMEIWGKSGMPYGPERASELARYMEAMNIPLTPDVYELLLKAWLRTYRFDSPKQCENLFRDMAVRDLTPTSTSFELLLRAWARSRLPGAVDKCWEVFRTMEQGMDLEVPQRLLGVMAMSLVKRRWAQGSSPPPREQQEAGVQLRFLLSRAGVIALRDEVPLDPLLCRAALDTLMGMSDEPNTASYLSDFIHLVIATKSTLTSRHSFRRITRILARENSSTSDTDSNNNMVDAFQTSLGKPMCVTLLNLRLASSDPRDAESTFLSLLAAHPNVNPDICSYNILLEQMARAARADHRDEARTWVDSVEEVLDGMMESEQPDAETFEVMADFWDWSCEEETDPAATGSALWKTETLFDTISRRLREDSGGRRVLPRSTNLRMVNAWCAQKSHTFVEKATALLFSVASGGATPGAVSSMLDVVVAAWIRCGQRERAHVVFTSILAASAVRPAPTTCRRLVDALTSTPRSVSNIEVAQYVYESAVLAGMPHDPDSVARILRSWVLTASGIAPFRTEQFLVRNIARGLVPTVDLLNVLLDVHAKSGLENAPETCEKLLFERLPELKVTPTIVSYNTVMAAWARSKDDKAFARADRIFQAALRDARVAVNVISYSSLLSALGKTGSKERTAELAKTIFDDMEEKGITPDRQSWTTLIGILARTRPHEAQSTFDRMLASGCTPNAVTYTTMLNLWGASEDPEASRRVLEIFRAMRSAGYRLDTIGYTSLISAIGRSGDADAPHRAIDVFEQMKTNDLKPDLKAYTVLISIMAKADLYDAADSIYRDLWNNGLEPSEVTFTMLLNMWSRSKHPEAASRIEELYDALCSANVVADGLAFRSLTRALSKCNGRMAIARKVETLLRCTIDFGARPDIMSFQTVLTSWLECVEEDAVVVEKVVSLLDLMTSIGGRPSKRVFYTVFGKLAEKPDRRRPRSKKQTALYASRDRPAEYRMVLDSFSRAGFAPTTRNFNQMLFLEVQSITGNSATVDVNDATVSRAEALLTELEARDLAPDRMTLKNVLALKNACVDRGCSLDVMQRLEGLTESLTTRLKDKGLQLKSVLEEPKERDG